MAIRTSETIGGNNALNIIPPNWTTGNATTTTKTTTTSIVTNNVSKVDSNQYVASSITHPYRLPNTTTTTTSNNSDFLRKIDEQLENSRKQFPS